MEWGCYGVMNYGGFDCPIGLIYGEECGVWHFFFLGLAGLFLWDQK